MGESSRLHGQRTLVCSRQPLSGRHVVTLPNMQAALDKSRRKVWKGVTEKDRLRTAQIGTKPVDGDPARLQAALAASEALVEEAVASDPRLARRAQWRRRDEGEECDPSLLYFDDQPFFKHTRAVVNDATNAGEAVKVVISTDDSKVPEGTAAAFIATARLVQQFIPLEIWWQGAWLTQDKLKGYVFLVPLVQGEMDFSRLEFCIADPCRDHFSFRVMSTYALFEINQAWTGCGFRADWSFLEGAGVHFVSHVGIRPDAESVAEQACKWLGWEEPWELRYNEREAASSAVQRLPDPPRAYSDPTAEQKRRNAEDYEAYRKKQALEAGNRINSVVED